METVEQRAVIKYLQKKRMSLSQIHEDMTATLGESAVSYGIVKIWFRTFKCGRTSCEGEHGGGPPRTVTTPENINKVLMPTHCTITCFGFHARWIDGVKCGLFSNHAPLGKTTLRVG